MPRRHTSSPTVKSLVQAAASLELPQLEELHNAIAALLSAVDTQPSGSDTAPTSPQARKGSRGGAHIQWKYIRGYGPYPYLRFRTGKKYKSYYLKELASAEKLDN